jgi:type VI secretion system protein VasG
LWNEAQPGEQTPQSPLRHDHYISDSLYDALTDACLLPDTGARNVDSLLNQQILPALSQQLLTHMAAGQKPQHLMLGRDEEGGL